MSVWNDDRAPISKRLPTYGWQDNEVAMWVTAAYDAVLVQLKEAIENFPDDFIDPDTCRADALDWLAQLCGYTGEYWDTGWDEAVKRQLIKDHQMVWGYKGTQYLLQYLLDLFELTDARIYVPGAFQAGISKAGDAVGGQPLTFGVAIGTRTVLGYIRKDAQWRLVDRLVRLYMPAWCAPSTHGGGFLHYGAFRAGFSVAGDPL